MNFALAETVEELRQWGPAYGRDSFGTYTIITGYEGTGACFWCGADLEGRRRFCGHRSGHWTAYWDAFGWAYARFECIKRADHKCESCGHLQSYHDPYLRDLYPDLEVHHIVPLEGGIRFLTPYNLPWNLVALCHRCHLDIHAVMREDSRPPVPTVFDLARARGQGVFELEEVRI